MQRFQLEPSLLIVREILPQSYAEKMLLATVLRRAAFDIAQYKRDRRPEARRLYREAKDWVFSDDDDSAARLFGEYKTKGKKTATQTQQAQLRLFDQLMSFRSLCWHLQQDPRLMRQKIMKLKKRDVRQYDMFNG
jgi:hypothetical protein